MINYKTKQINLQDTSPEWLKMAPRRRIDHILDMYNAAKREGNTDKCKDILSLIKNYCDNNRIT
jgi:hypothetical protein